MMILIGFLVALAAIPTEPKKYDPTWASLDTRPLPQWFDDGKVGIFIHWGVFSVIGYSSEWVWWQWKGSKNPDVVKFFADNYDPDVTYADFASQFHATFFNPDQWADVFSNAGAKYIVLTSKHHEGFTLWPSKHSFNWNAMDVGPHRDLVNELATSVRNRTKLHFGLYHSMFDWFHPLYLQDQANGYRTRFFPEAKALPELYEIVNAYKPDVIWSDGEWEASDAYWNSTSFIAWLYNESPVKDTVVTNDRWGNNTRCLHGGFFDCADNFNPGTLQPKKWENCMPLDTQSWGYRRNLNVWDVVSIDYLLGALAATVSCGGNLLVNVGPTGDGTIVPIFQQRLLQMGAWLNVNGDAIYSTKPWSHQNDTVNPNVWYTSKKSADGVDVYAVILKREDNATVSLGAPKPSKKTVVTMLGSPDPLKWRVVGDSLQIKLPELKELPAPEELVTLDIFVLKLTYLTNKPKPKEIMRLPEEFRRYSKIRGI